MGTTSVWTQVLEFGGIVALALLFLDTITDRERVARGTNLFGTVVGALVAGMLKVFGWRVLHGTIALLFVGVLLVTFGAGFVIRRGRKRAEMASKVG